MTRFLHIGRGSAVELEYHLLLARDLMLLSASSFNVLVGDVDEAQRMLTGLIQRVQPIGPNRSKAKERWIQGGLEAHGS
jgi:four helix bundle protein